VEPITSSQPDDVRVTERAVTLEGDDNSRPVRSTGQV